MGSILVHVPALVSDVNAGILTRSKMKKGDLVCFHSRSMVFKDREQSYANPGIVVQVDRSHRQTRYVVYWSDGKTTREFAGYLKKQEEMVL